MSYLNALRLHFAGQFQANISTVNNDPAHFYNEKFILPDYQEMQGPNMNPPNGWFNPQGDANWRLLGCSVTSAWTSSGQASADDPVLGCLVADSDTQAPAKLVDLDSEQQLTSEIWGLQVRLVDGRGNTLMRGDFKAAPFIDIWDRATGPGGDVNAGAIYQSVLTNVEWYDVSSSPFLTALRKAAADGPLSIKFNVDGINFTSTAPNFMCGRITGTIGPHTAGEPQHMVLGRHFIAEGVQFPAPQSTIHFFRPVGQLNHCVARLDAETGSVFLDLGNALPTASPGGPLDDLGTLLLSAIDPNTSHPVLLGSIMPQGPNGYASQPGVYESALGTDTWYEWTAGVVELKLDQQSFQLAASSQLVITGDNAQSTYVSEWASGAYVRADEFVYRLTPGEEVQMPVYAMQWGQPLPGTPISFRADPSQLQPGSFIQTIPTPPVATPPEALGLPAAGVTVVTDGNGRAVLSITPTDPGTPRYFNNGKDYGIDGQVYGIRPAFRDASLLGGPVNQWDFISVLLWSGFTTPDPVTWWPDLQPIFQQYANLYPVMGRFLDLSSYDDVVKNKELLKLAFGLRPDNPNVMPVTRDLSPAKLKAILSFLDKPQLGTPPPKAPAVKAEAAEPAVATVPAALASRGGKAAASARRLVLQKK